MPQKSKFNLPPIQPGKESIGKRIARFRKEKGVNQAELAEKIGNAQNLISCLENDSRGLSAEMTIRVAMALGITADDLLGFKERKNGTKKPSLKVMKRVSKIEELPSNQQKTLLNTIDTFLKEKGL